MFRILDICAKYLLGCGLALALFLPLQSARATSFEVLHTFRGVDGEWPQSGLIADKARNLYGTTLAGGANGGGTVFRFTLNGSETVLHSFCSDRTNCADGSGPAGDLILDELGNLYGTSGGGGSNSGGTVFEISPNGMETVLYSFCSQHNCSDGRIPIAGLIADRVGNLYGTTYRGGTGCSDSYGCGTVFELSPPVVKGGAWTEKVLHLFTYPSAKNDGYNPYAGVIADKAGNLYGTTLNGGSPCGCGIVFSLAPNGTETVLHVFGGDDGGGPVAGLIADKAGNLYGTTYLSGPTSGEIFKLANDGKLTVLYGFRGGSDGANSVASLIADAKGNLYGTTIYGGKGTCFFGGQSGCGTVFGLAPDGTETVLHAFKGGRDGAYPEAGLMADRAGNLYGTTFYGGKGNCTFSTMSGCGTVFKITK